MMRQGCCCLSEEKLYNKCGAERRKSGVKLWVYEVMIVLLSLVLGGQRAVAVPSTSPVAAFHTFHLRPLGRGEQEQHYYSQSRWEDLRKNSPEDFPLSRKKAAGHGGRMGLRLVHRDARDSPFRSNLNSKQANNITVDKEADFATIFQNSLQRDAARVRALDFIITKKTAAVVTSRRVHAVGPPLQSPIFPGLDSGSGEYFTTLSIGTPPAPVLVTIDTGSDLVWLQCRPCYTCYDQIGPIFDSKASGSYKPVPCFSWACATLADSHCEGKKCMYMENYGDGSFSTGEFASETITMNSTGDTPFELHNSLFGCGRDNEGLFIASGGLLGLGRGHLSFPSQLSSVLEPRFSYCLTDRFPSSTTTTSTTTTETDGDGDDDGHSSGNEDDVEHEGQDDGEMAMTATSYLFFGEAETQSMQYTALIRNPAAPSFYYLQLTGLSVGDELVAIPASAFELDMSSGRGGVIVDTGTAVTRLASDAYGALRDAFRSKAEHLTRVDVPNQEFFDSCYQLAEGDSVPSVTMHFAGGVDLELPIDNTMIPVDDSGSLYCLAFARSSLRGGLTIIGNVQQQGFRIEFDLGKNQVGFTREDCSVS